MPALRKPASDRRAEIADTALTLAGTSGLSGLTMASLAAEIGLTSGALFRHFDSREAILLEAVRRAAVRVNETFPSSEDPPLDRLLALARNRVRLLRRNPGDTWLLRSAEALLALPDEAVAELRDLVQRSRRFLLRAMTAGQLAGTIRDDIPPNLLLPVVTGTIHTLAGPPGAASLDRGPRLPAVEPALEALRTLLAPPA